MKNKPVRKSEADWLAHVIASSKAKSMTEYAKIENIDINQLYLWKSKLIKSGQLKNGAPGDSNSSLFEKVPVTRTSHSVNACKIILPNQICIEFSSLDNLDCLTDLITRLGARL